MIDRSHALPAKPQAQELGIIRGSVYHLLISAVQSVRKANRILRV